MNRCAFPGCDTEIVSKETGTIIGEVCHIRAKSPGGPRYVGTQDDNERNGFANLILLCGNHHKEIDDSSNLERFTTEWLVSLKADHEAAASQVPLENASDSIIAGLTLAEAKYESGATHLDLRNAVFKVGGEGGGPLGGGGSGGILTIVGIASLPADVQRDVTIDLSGGSGSYPGGGGGGGGLLKFVGRAATRLDVDAGLRVSLFFPSNNATVSEGLLYVLGAAWGHYWVPELPIRGCGTIAFTLETGTLDPNTLLTFDVRLVDPQGDTIWSAYIDVDVIDMRDQIKRTSRTLWIAGDFTIEGLHSFVLSSGDIVFARYEFEVGLAEPSPNAGRVTDGSS